MDVNESWQSTGGRSSTSLSPIWTNRMLQQRYGWADAEANCSHTYLLPSVMRAVVRATGGRSSRVVDIGCGNGFVSARLASAGHEVFAFDASPDGIEIAEKTHQSVQFRVASVYDEDLGDRVARDADCAIALEVIEHLFFPRKLFGAARQVLRPGGTLVVSTPYHGYLKNLAISLANGWDTHFTVGWDGGHIKFFSPRTLRHIAESEGFRVLNISGAGRLPGLWKSMILIAVYA